MELRLLPLVLVRATCRTNVATSENDRLTMRKILYTGKRKK